MQHAVVFVCTYKCVCKQSYVTDVLQTPFYNTILETEHKLCMASGLSTPPPPPKRKMLGAHLEIVVNVSPWFLICGACPVGDSIGGHNVPRGGGRWQSILDQISSS